jgi:drug/metabolite transporter (DMT)-like permease
VGYLVITSLVWALSFGLVRHHLAGVDAGFVALARLALALVVLLPFVRVRGLSPRHALALFAIGFVQLGLMYATYQESFRYLEAYQVALFTVLTPLWVTLIDDALGRRFHARALGAAALAAVGTAIVVYRGVGNGVLLWGFALVQASNVFFAAGQIAYARLMPRLGARPDRNVFALVYFGAVVAAGAAFAVRAAHVPDLTARHASVLLYLGVVASGIGFLLWNIGARRVDAGTLAVMNNLKVPLGVACSIALFGEQASWPRLLAGGAVIAAALWVNGRGGLARSRICC